MYNGREYLTPPKTIELTTTGIDTSQGYILDVNSNVVSFDGANSCVPNSASFIGASGRGISNDQSIMKKAGEGVDRTRVIERKPGFISNLSALPFSDTVTTVTEGTTTKYFQRVYDAGTSGWCYYTKTSIDATPDASETTPNYTGAISNHTIVEIFEVIGF